MVHRDNIVEFFIRFSFQGEVVKKTYGYESKKDYSGDGH